MVENREQQRALRRIMALRAALHRVVRRIGTRCANSNGSARIFESHNELNRSLLERCSTLFGLFLLGLHRSLCDSVFEK